MRIGAALAAAAAVALGAGTARATEVKLLSSNAIKTVLEELVPQFEKATEHKVKIVFGTAAGLKASIEKGELFDVAILTGAGIDSLIKDGKIAAATRADLARAGVGVAVKKGAPKPDIGTTDAFKRALLAAKSVAYVEQGASGIYLKGLFDRLGMTDALKPKLTLLPASNPAAQAVANGEVEIGMTQISEILPYAGAELVGPLPADIQLITVFAAGAAAQAPDAAQALIKFLKTPAAAAVIKAKGLEPG